MRKFKVNNKYIVTANTHDQAISIVKSIKANDSDKLKQLAYKFAEMGSYFDRANSASSRQILSKNDEAKYFDYYKLALEVKKQLEIEVPKMTNTNYLYTGRSDTMSLLHDAVSRFYYTMLNCENRSLSQKGMTLANQIDQLIKTYRNAKRDSISDSIASDIVKEIKKAYPQVQIHQETFNRRGSHGTQLLFKNYPGQGTSDGKRDKWEQFLKYLCRKHGLSDRWATYNELYIEDSGKYDSLDEPIEDDEESDITMLSEEEEKAIADYRKAIANTKDPKLLKLFGHILKEEVEHLEELQSGEMEDSINDEKGVRSGDQMEKELQRVLKNPNIEYNGDAVFDDDAECLFFGDSTKKTAQDIAKYLKSRGYSRVSVDKNDFGEYDCCVLRQGYKTGDSLNDDDLDNAIAQAIKRGTLDEHPYDGKYALRVRASEYDIVEKKLRKQGYKVSTGGNPYNSYNVFFWK